MYNRFNLRGMNKIVQTSLYILIGLLALIAGIGILKVLIYIVCEILLITFTQPLIALIGCILFLLVLFLLPDRKK